MQTEIKAIVNLIEAKELDKAEKRIDVLLNRKKKSSQLLYIKAIIAKEKQDFSSAEGFLEQSLKYDPDNLFTLQELTSTQVALNKNKEAIKNAERILKRQPKNTDALLSLLNAQVKLHYHEEAEQTAEVLLKLEPNNILALYLASLCFYNQKKLAEAVNTAIKALEFNPNLPYMRVIIADHYSEQENKYSIAIQLLREEIKLHPDSATAYRMLGACFARIGDIKSCLEYTKKQIEVIPGCGISRSNLLLFSHYCPDMTAEGILEIAQDYYDNCLSQNLKIDKEYDHKSRTKNSKMKIGFVSGDLRNHAVYYWLREFFKHLAKEDVEIFIYCNNDEDKCSEDLKQSATDWYNIQEMNDKEVCDLIYKENIDILYDLSGHTAKNRMGVFFNKPAPVQVTWLGQSGPLGLPQIDYMMTDRYLVKEGEDKDYTEKIYRMPHNFAPYGTLPEEIEIKDAPYKKNGFITFGCFNSFTKVNQLVMLTWLELLKKTENTRLHLKSHLFIDEIVLNNFRTYFQKQGIAAERIILEAFDKDRTNYMNKYNEIDIALDPFPLGGGTTTNDLLFMGVPLISLAGKRMSHRVSASLLNLIGCHELIANTREEYIEKAINLSQNLEQIDLYKKTLRDRYLKSPQVDSKLFTQDFVKACKEMIDQENRE